ncbi:MAG: 2-oxo acid dehydrogenase subunit E2 [SAR202 cluster bacterium]|nr:2-oxo acid dehydrogenase subunit E2 [SAR202 cluster bacterium]
MATTIVMPQMGYDMKEGTVVRWHKQEGDAVARGEVIADIQTDKATVEFEAYTAGVLRKIVAQAGVPVPVGELIAVITDPNEPLPDELPVKGAAGGSAPAAQAALPAAQASAAATAPVQPAPATPADVRASPIARRLARERGIDLSLVVGSGPGGRIVEKDVLSFAEARPAAPARPAAAAPAPAPAAQRVELSRMRQAIAKITVDSKREAPHFYVTSDVDMTRAMSLRREINETLPAERRVSVNDLIIKASAVALGRHPKFNAFFRGDHLQMNPSINIGIAIALPAGLIVPGIGGCQDKSLVQIADASKDLIARANSGTLRNDEYSNTTFSISNLGPFDVDSFAAIIFPPHAAILAVGRVKEQPVVREGQLAVAQIMKATLATDHRVADGAEAAQFLVEIRKLLEAPLSLLL